MALTQATKTELYRFFVIAFDAAPGVEYMSQMTEASEYGMSVQEIVEVFTTKPQFLAVYPNFLTNEQFAARIIENVVGESAGDAAKLEAIADVAGALNAGWTRGEVIYQIFNNLAAKSFDDPVWGATAEQMANQVIVAQYYTEQGVPGNTTTDLPTLQAVIAGVDQNTDVSTPAAIEAAIASGMPPVLHVLTTGIDSIVGGAGADEILGGTATLGLGDYIDGGDGKDVLSLTLAGDGGEAGSGLYAGFDVKNVETINLRSIGYDNEVWVSMTGVEGLETLNIVRSTNETTVEDLQNMVDVNLDDVADDVGIYFDWNEIETRTLDLSVKEVGSSAGGSVDLDIDGEVEVLNIDDRGTAGKTSNFELYGAGLDQINVTGGEGYAGGADEQVAGVQQAHLSLDWIDTNGGTTLDSTGYAGDLRAATTQWDVDTIATGAGDDQLMIYSDWDYGNTIETNDGDDSVTIYGEDYGYDDATVNGSIITGNGDDTVHVYSDYGYYGYYGESAVGETGLIDTGAGDDYVYLDGGIDGDGADADDVPGQVLLGSGNDTLVVQGEDYYGYDDGDVNGLVDAGEGDDLIQLYNSTVGDTGVVMGGEGDDQLQLWNSNYDNATVVNAAATITGIETLALGNTDYDDGDLDHQIDLDAFDEALTRINIVNASSATGYADQEVVLTNLTTESIGITSTDSDDGDDVELDVSLKDGSGEEDSLTVELFGGTATSPAKFEVDLNDSLDNIESLNLVNNGFGNREVDTSQDFDVSLTVTGDSEDDLRVFNSTSQLVDATAYAGDFTIEVATEQDYEIRTGSGDDVINLVDDKFTNGDTLDGGAGTDRLVLDESTQTVDTEEDEAFDNVNNIEILEVLGEDDGTLYVTFDDDVDRAGIAHLIVSGQDNDDDGLVDEAANVALTIGADYELALTVDHTNGTLDIDNDGAADIDVNLDANGGRSLIFTDASNGGEINLNVLIADGGVDTFIDNGQTGAGLDGSILLDVLAGSIDSITLLDNVGDGSGSDNGFVEIIIDDMWTNGALDLLEEVPAIGALTIDASDIADDDLDSTTGGVYIDGLAETNTELTLTGSANDDFLIGGAQDDVIVGGAGDDFIEGFLGADVLSGGAGNDTLWGDDSTGLSLYDPLLNYNDTIDGGAGDDIISGGFGQDLLTGGAGADQFWYDAPADSQGTQADTITDFASGVDLLVFTADMLAAAGVINTEIKFMGNVNNDLLVLSAMTGGTGGLPESGYAEAVYQTTSQLLYVDLNNDGAINDGDIVIGLTGVAQLTQDDIMVDTQLMVV